MSDEITKIKVSALTETETLEGFYALGVNASNQSRRANLGRVQTATDAANTAAGNANSAATAAGNAADAASETNTAIQQAEAARVTAENTRSTNESTRQTNETARQTAINNLVATGAWSSSTAYLKNNTFLYAADGCAYMAILNAPAGTLPTNTTYFKKIAQKGADGSGSGDMLKATYDPDGDGKVVSSVNSDQLGGVDAASYAKLDSPALTGTPTAPTATTGTNTAQIANTAFVQAAIAALVASSPAALDTLNELAAALGNDANFAATMTAALAAKQATLVSGTNIKTINGTSLLGSGDITISSGGGTATGEIWTALTATYASATTFTLTGTSKDVGLLPGSLFTCTDSAGTTRRVGFVRSAVLSGTTVTVTVSTDTDLTSTDINFKVAYNHKATVHIVTIPGECIADTSYSQGMFYSDTMQDSYLLSVDASVLTPASGTSAALTFNVYAGSTALFATAPDLATNTVLHSQRPSTKAITTGDTVSLRIMASAGATNKASDFQAKLFIAPQALFTAF